MGERAGMAGDSGTEEGIGARREPDLTLIVPAYNEENRIDLLLRGMPGVRARYIIVCDGTDRTPALVKEFAASHPDIDLQCLEYPRRLGKGGAIAEGMRHATTAYVGFMDADGSASAGTMGGLLATIDSADGVIGSRWVPGAVLPVHQGLLRRFQSRAFNGMIRYLLGLPFRDTQCGAKLFRKSAIDEVLPEIVSHGFEFDAELLWRMKKHGFFVKESPITWTNRGNSRVHGRDVIHMLAGLISLRVRSRGT